MIEQKQHFMQFFPRGSERRVGRLLGTDWTFTRCPIKEMIVCHIDTSRKDVLEAAKLLGFKSTFDTYRA